MSAGTQTCDVVIPGYMLAERIGAGGYAEVWRAEAPGGIEKAVKIVHGFHDDEFAAQELKALERIKGVRHPFLLSLERFEIINGRLAILTELADMSLDQRLRQCRVEGLSGIPREELLRYMADAAEALDFLSQRHGLLHLDIKPENLLILGDHIKVADFGLVKELSTRTQNSLVSGMTPTYASPEMFDDEPSAHSDQYSLAIVFQEMLVGVLPFPGRTSAQLAKQHTQSEPQLMALSVEDRPIVARALSKKPDERFPSCRAFIDALSRHAEVTPAHTPCEAPRLLPAAPKPAPFDPDDTKPPSYCTTIRRGPEQEAEPVAPNVTQPVRRGSRPSAPPEARPAVSAVLYPEEITDVPVPNANAELSAAQPTLYIATGGVGIQVINRLRDLKPESEQSNEASDSVEVIALDTSREELRDAASAKWKSPLGPDDVLHLPLRLPQSYDNARDILGWVSRRWLYNIPRSLETRGYRPLGRVALVDHAKRVREVLQQKLQRLIAKVATNDEAHPTRESSLRVVIVCGTGGGTGAGMAIDLANAVRSLAAEQNVPIEVQGIFVCTCFASNASTPLVAANTFSLLTELYHAANRGNRGTGENASHTPLFESDRAPFDCVYWVPALTRPRAGTTGDALDGVAKYLALHETEAVRAALRTCRTSPTPRDTALGRLVIKKIGYASMADQKRVLISRLAAELDEAIRRYWLTKDTSADWDWRIREEQRAAVVPKPQPQASAEANEDPPEPAVDEASPLALRARFKEFAALEFTSEMIRQIRRQCEPRDARSRPVLHSRDAKFVADAAREFAALLTEREGQQAAGPNRFADSPALRPLIAAGSRRVLTKAADKLDPKQPERVLQLDVVDCDIAAECQALLDESLADPNHAHALLTLINFDEAVASAIENATTDFLQCGFDRRTLVFTPKNAGDYSREKEQLTALRPLAAFVEADVDDVVIVSEESGISPRSIALGLERVFPGIADAAHRLFTRIDVEWQRLI